MDKSVNIISLGCAKNLVDSEILLGGLNKSELLITENIEDDNQTTEIESSNKDFERLLLDRIKNN